MSARSGTFQPCCVYTTNYDAALPAFGVTRHDNALMLAFTLLDRRLDFHGFDLELIAPVAEQRNIATPRFSYVFTDQHSG